MKFKINWNISDANKRMFELIFKNNNNYNNNTFSRDKK